MNGTINIHLDHGILNVPLAKRGNIDAQIDRYKAEQALAARAERKARAERFRADKAAAKSLFAEIGQQMIDAFAAKYGRKEVRALLDGWVKWQPSKFLAAAKQFQSDRAEPVQ